MNTAKTIAASLDLLGLDNTPTTANRYADTYITTVLPGSKAEAVARQIVKDANVNRRKAGLNPLRICARGRGKGRLVRAGLAGYVTCASKVAQDLPRAAAEKLDLYVYEYVY